MYIFLYIRVIYARNISNNPSIVTCTAPVTRAIRSIRFQINIIVYPWSPVNIHGELPWLRGRVLGLSQTKPSVSSDSSRLHRDDISGHIGLFCVTQWRHRKPFWMGPRWKQGYISPPPPCFIVLASSVKIQKVKVIEFHRIFYPVIFWKYALSTKCDSGVWLRSTKLWRRKGFIQLKIIINVLVGFFRFIWIPILWVYGNYKFVIVSAGSESHVFGRQNLAYRDVRFWRLNTVPALERLIKLHGYRVTLSPIKK